MDINDDFLEIGFHSVVEDLKQSWGHSLTLSCSHGCLLLSVFLYFGLVSLTLLHLSAFTSGTLACLLIGTQREISYSWSGPGHTFSQQEYVKYLTVPYLGFWLEN